MNLPILENFDDKNKKKKEPTFEAHEYNKKLMGASGLFALAGMGLSVAKARKKLKDKWNREKAMALREGRPVPPPPDLSKGAIIAMLKGAIGGAALGTAAGMFVPGLNEVGATVHGVANKALTGSALKSGRRSKAFFSDMLIDDEIIQISQEFFSDLFSYGCSEEDMYNYVNFSKKSKKKNKNKEEKKSFEKEMIEKAKKKGKDFLDKNPYNKADAEAMAAQNPMKRSLFDPKANYLIPALTAAGGGLTSTIMAYRKAIEEWKGQYDAAIENNEVPPEKPELSEFLGAGMKGAITGGISGAVLNKVLMGSDKGKELLGKAENIANQVGVITNRRKANKFIKHQGEHTVSDKLRKALRKANDAKDDLAYELNRTKSGVVKGAKDVGKGAVSVKDAVVRGVVKAGDVSKKAYKNAAPYVVKSADAIAKGAVATKDGIVKGSKIAGEKVSDFGKKARKKLVELKFNFEKGIPSEKDLEKFEKYLNKNPSIREEFESYTGIADVHSVERKQVKKAWDDFLNAYGKYEASPLSFSNVIYENSYLSGFNYIMSGNYNDSIGLENTNFSGTTVVAPAAPDSEGESISYNFSGIDVANTHFTFQDYKDTLACYGMETTLTEELFNFSYNDEKLKINLIKNMMLKDL